MLDHDWKDRWVRGEGLHEHEIVALAWFVLVSVALLSIPVLMVLLMTSS